MKCHVSDNVSYDTATKISTYYDISVPPGCARVIAPVGWDNLCQCKY